MLFPMPLVPFEQYMLEDDRPHCPMTFLFRLGVRGRLDSAALEAALSVALSRHPLLAAVVDRRRTQPCWHAAPQSPRLHVSAGAAPWPSHGIDITTEPGLRVLLRPNEAGADLWFQAHHAATDAIGLVQFVSAVLRAYAGLVGVPADPKKGSDPLESRGLTPFSDPRQLRKRAHWRLSCSESLRRIPRDLRDSVHFLTRKVLSLGNPPALPGAQPFPAFCSRHFTHEETGNYFAKAKRERVTINTLLLRDLFSTLQHWLGPEAANLRRRYIRVAVPVNLRHDDEAMPCTNRVSMVFVDRRPSECADAGALLQGLAAEMSRIKRHRVALTMVRMLTVIRAIPGLLPLIVSGQRCHATTVLSNLGPIFDDLPLAHQDGRLLLGDAAVESVDFLVPVRPHTAAAFGVGTYGGRLHVCLHYDPRQMKPAAASRLLNSFSVRLTGGSSPF